MKILNQDNQYITDKYDHGKRVTNYHEKIEHMVNLGYGSIEIDGKTVSYVGEYEVDGERYVTVSVE